MNTNLKRPLLGKIIFHGIIKAETGLHIGTSREALEIGAEDLPVVRDPITREPYIPGSSLKGKMRALSERRLYGEGKLSFNRSIKDIKIHVCDKKEEAEECEVCRVFGSTAGKDAPRGSNYPSRLKVRDSRLTKYSVKELENLEEGLLYTEVKFENVLDRITASATPRQIERIPAGAEFSFELVYDVEDIEKLEDDLNTILSAIELLEDDTLGGHGSRGYGKVKFFFFEGIGKKIDAYKSESYNEKNVKVIKKDEIKWEEFIKEKREDPSTFTFNVKEFKEKINELVEFFKSNA